MAKAKTVLILGAGASHGYGFPVGSQLAQRILELRDDEEASNGMSFGKQTIRDFVDAFRDAQSYSIDAFLGRRPEFVEVGKAAIAYILLTCEQTADLKNTENRDMREGYLQLATRYTPGNGSLSATYGGLVGYLRRENSAKCMSSWMEHFKADVNAQATITPCNRRGPLGFISEHEHSSLGIPFRIWHFCVSLHFDPQDKSGRTAKKYK